MISDLAQMAELLGRLRTSGRAIPIGAAEALLWVAAGVDSVPELAAVMGTEGAPLPPATISRLVSLLRGRARYDRGQWIESPTGALIACRRHPHRRGLQLLLTEEGAQVLNPYAKGENKCTTLLGLPLCAPAEDCP